MPGPPSPLYGNDYVVINSGATFAVGADPVLVSGGYTTYIQYYKLGYGPTGAFTPVSASNPFPVTVATGLTAIISGFTGPIQVQGVVGGQAVTVSGAVIVSGISSAPVYVQTSPNCYVEVTGGRYLNKLNDNVSVFGPNGSTWIYSSLVNSAGTELGNAANPVYVQISGATINATINPTVGVTNTSSTPLFICGTSGATAVSVTVGNTVGINDTAILLGMTGIYNEVVDLNNNLSTLGISRPTTFVSGRTVVTSSGFTAMYGTGYTTGHGVNIKSASYNTDIVYINSNSLATIGYELDPGQDFFIDVININTVLIKARTGSQTISFLAS
jgi:hypothetical protein